MKTVAMIAFGRMLTDSEFGKKIAATVIQENVFPVVLDFKGVIALGSSCGDELIHAVVSQQGNRIEVIHANEPIKDCLSRVAEDLGVTIVHRDGI